MLKETIKYTDYNGLDRTEDFYFNLSKAELLRMEMSTVGGYAEMIEGLINAQDTPAVYAIFEELILKAYGVKSADGREFTKSEDLKTKFSQTEAYSNLIMKLVTDANAAAKFINGLMPQDLVAQVQKEQKNAASEQTSLE